MSYNFNTTPGQTVGRELLLAFLNCGTNNSPVWKVVGKRVEDSSTEYDWSTETKKDILGNTWGSMKKPIITQGFDPCELDAADVAQKKIWDLAVVEQNAQALSNMDMLIVHAYAGFGERYESCMIEVGGEGGEGGGQIGLPFNVTYGGTRTRGAVSISGGNVTFTPETSSISVSPETLSLAEGATKSVVVTGASGAITAASSASTVATALVGDNYVLVSGVDEGTATITITNGSNTATVAVTVTAAL